MKALLFTLIVVFTIGQSYAQLCNGNIVYNSTAEFCPYPGGKSCCDPVIFDGYRDLLDQALICLPKDCKEYYRGLFCSACDPLSRGEVMCKSFCMKFVKGCLSDFPGGGDFICGDLPDTYCFKGFDFDPLPPREICGVFGDPHVRLFDGSGKTCKSAGTVTYFKSSDLLIEGTNTVVDTTTGATAITSLKVTYKGETETFNVGSYYPSFSGNDVSDVPLFGGRTYTFLSIDTRLSTRIASNEIFFTISSPNKGETSICKSGCPGQEINILSFPNGRRMAQAQAEEDCIEAGLEKGSFHFKACVYDVSVTGDKNYALSAKEYSNVEADALAEEEYRKKSSAIENTINVFVILISALIALVQF